MCVLGREDRRVREYCWNGDLCAVDPSYAGVMDYGPCVSEDYCRAALEAELPAACMYSDQTLFVNGPPEVAECPPGPAVQGFCGGPCDDCPREVSDVGKPWEGEDNWRTACTGLSETRGVGVCSFGFPPACSRDDPNDWAQSCSFYFGVDCVCLTFIGDDGEQEIGWVTLQESCVAYRELFPGQLECRRPVTWEVIAADAG